ncbi:MAG: hypothetical protein LBF93_06680 [Zoogloeaceae bacterium]|jgi:prophage antirepressor-like protein|nr:hypothetical protein [Zoogloeaceae bacterium]
MNHLIPAEFIGTSLEVIDHDGRRWLTGEQIGLALGFAPNNARIGIIRLYNRHEAEFTDEDTTVVNLTTVEGGIEKEREFRIFSASGCILLSFFAQTKRAAAFRAWSKQHLAAHLESRPALTADEIPAITRKYAAERDAARQALLLARPDWAKAIRYREMGLTYAETARLLALSESQVDKRYRAIRAAGLPLAAPAVKLAGAALLAHQRATDRALLAAARQGVLPLQPVRALQPARALSGDGIGFSDSCSRFCGNDGE